MNDEKLILSRRSFLGKGALLGSGILTSVVAGQSAAAEAQNAILKSSRPDAPYELDDPENILYSVCLNCNTGCGIKTKIQSGVLAKIDGNPYSPFTMVPHLPMSASPEDAASIDGGLCPKGQAGVQTAYDPYRIRKVLKRAGKRGENKWQTIPFEQAIQEIVAGGKLFAHIPGEENRHVEGLKEIMALRDDAVMTAMGHAVDEILSAKDKAKKKTLVEGFKIKFKDHLHTLIDPDHPDLGPKNNQLVVAYGRLKNGRKDFFKRFTGGFGTVNLHGHTTVCQGSLYFTCKAISEQYQDGKFGGGKKFYWQTDLEHARYVLFVGANLFEANYGPTNRTVRLTENLARGYTKIAVVDPRYSKLASKADKWLPIKPGEDAALALAMIQWMIRNNRYDKNFLECANKAAASARNEHSWSNAPWLVEIKDGKPGKFVRAADLGYAAPQSTALLVMDNGKPRAFDPNNEKTAVFGDLLVDGEIIDRQSGKTVRVKSAMQLLKESSEEHSFEEWCDIAGLSPKDVISVTRELTSYGKQASVDLHRGPAQHTNGFYNVLAWMSVNMLLGNIDWKGGLSKANTFGYNGSKGGPFRLDKFPGKMHGFGINSIRYGMDYEKTTIFEGYPAKRNWYPLASDIYEEIIPSIGDAYPYPVKALIFYMGAPTYALPAGHTNIEILADVEKLPLFIASDILVGTTSMYADYIFPDLSYLERWEFQGSHPNMPSKIEPVRQPVIPPIPDSVTVYGETQPICLESMFMALAEKLGTPSFGKDACGKGMDLNRPDDFYVRAVTNIAIGKKPVPKASRRELEIFSKSRRHLPKHVFDEARWRQIVGEENWAHFVYVMNRGGRFEEHHESFKGDKLAHPYGALLNMYQEKTAGNKYAGTGKNYPGVAVYLPQKNYAGETLEKLKVGYDLHMITNRTILQTKSRTISNYWLQPIMPENGIMINPADAKRLGLQKGDRVRVVSATNTAGEWDLKNGQKRAMEGQVILTQTMRPGVISFVLGFGHWATGAADMTIDGQVIKGDPRREKGVHANAAMWTDSSLRNNTCLIDPVGGSVSFYDTRVKLIRV